MKSIVPAVLPLYFRNEIDDNRFSFHSKPCPRPFRPTLLLLFDIVPGSQVTSIRLGSEQLVLPVPASMFVHGLPKVLFERPRHEFTEVDFEEFTEVDFELDSGDLPFPTMSPGMVATVVSTGRIGAALFYGVSLRTK